MDNEKKTGSRENGFIRISLVALGLILIARAFLGADCSALTLGTFDLELRAGERELYEFYLVNNSRETFYIERVTAFNHESGIRTEAVKWDQTAESFGYASLFISAEAEEKACLKNCRKKAHVEIRGRFLSGKTCHYYELSKEYWIDIKPKTVTVKRPESLNCDLFEIEIPKRVEIKVLGNIPFTVKNYTSQDAIIRMNAIGAKLETAYYFVPAKTVAEKRLLIGSCSENAEITITANAGECGKIQQKLAVINTAIEKTEEPEKIEERPPEVLLDYKAEQKNGIYVINAILKNKSGYFIEGELFTAVPEGWQGEGKIIQLGPFSEKKAKLSVKPAADTEGNYAFDIVYAYGGLASTKKVELLIEKTYEEEEKYIIPTIGFSTLAEAGIAAGVMVFLAILLIGAILHNKPKNTLKKEEWQQIQKI